MRSRDRRQSRRQAMRRRAGRLAFECLEPRYLLSMSHLPGMSLGRKPPPMRTPPPAAIADAVLPRGSLEVPGEADRHHAPPPRPSGGHGRELGLTRLHRPHTKNAPPPASPPPRIALSPSTPTLDTTPRTHPEATASLSVPPAVPEPASAISNVSARTSPALSIDSAVASQSPSIRALQKEAADGTSAPTLVSTAIEASDSTEADTATRAAPSSEETAAREPAIGETDPASNVERIPNTGPPSSAEQSAARNATDEVLTRMIDIGLLPQLDEGESMPNHDGEIRWPTVHDFDVIPVPMPYDSDTPEPSPSAPEEDAERDDDQQATEEATDEGEEDDDRQSSVIAESEEDEEDDDIDLVVTDGILQQGNDPSILEGMIRLDIEPAESPGTGEESSPMPKPEAVAGVESAGSIESVADANETPSVERIDMDRGRGHLQDFELAAVPAEAIPDFPPPLAGSADAVEVTQE